MIDATEDYHTCTVCSTTVHDFGVGADAVLFQEQWFHKECFITTSNAASSFQKAIETYDKSKQRTTEML